MKQLILDDKCKIAESTKLIREMFDSNITKKQMDLIYVIISNVKPGDKEFQEYEISYKTIAKIMNQKNPYTKEVMDTVQKAIKGIMNSSFRLQSDKTEYYYHWVEKAVNNTDSQTVAFSLSNDVKEFYLQLKKGEYTVYLLENIVGLSTVFQACVFRWLYSNSGFHNEVKIGIENAKLCFYGKEIETKTFTRRLDKALEVINKKTNIQAEYTKEKTKNKITALVFKIKNKYEKKTKPRSQAKILADQKRNLELWKECEDAKKRCMVLKDECEKKENENNYLRARLDEKDDIEKMISEKIQEEMEQKEPLKKETGKREVPKFDLFD